MAPRRRRPPDAQLGFDFDAPPEPALEPPAPPPPAVPTDRQLLGLPETGPLDAECVRLAHRIAAGRCHPASGGDPVAYEALAAARDRLLAALRG